MPLPSIDNFIFDNSLMVRMADAMTTYAITIGIFVFLVGILFGTRAKRPKESPSMHEG